jgi:hypothetical protein
VGRVRIPRDVESRSDRWRATWRGPRSFTCSLPSTQLGPDALHEHLASHADAVVAALAGAEGVHSFRACATPPFSGDGHRSRALLNVVHDQPLPELLEELFARVGEPLTAAFAPLVQPCEPADWPAWLVRHRVRENTLHLGAVNATVREIRADKQLRRLCRAFADEQLERGAWSPATPPLRMCAELRSHVAAALSESDGIAVRASLSLAARAARAVDFAATFLFPAFGVLVDDIHDLVGRAAAPARRALRHAAFTLWWLYAVAPTSAALSAVRVVEWSEGEPPPPPIDPERWARLEAGEDRFTHNEVTLWLPVRDSFARRFLLRVVLFGAEGGCRHLWNVGRLAGIDTIHHARILQLDRGRTMAFLSDYDGGLDRYLGDFLGVGSHAVVPISSNLAHCPKTRWLFGREDPERFASGWRAMIRAGQLETSIWYGAYRDTSVREILANRKLRDTLFASDMDERAARRWLRSL